ADQSAPQTGLDRRLARSLRRGTAEVDATLDLHGCTQAEAHQRLVHFVQAAALRGNVILRIITGKGARGEGSESGGGRGILRRRVPEWLAEAPLGPLIRGVTVAGPRQGGDGALYVVLKRGRG
ncbi:MAG: Smr/MutS family protein, partial [Alphaproteobacteria bacterium]|nr:Smr/MutS family protein [Alphaproteobacteria bacterium]